MHNGLKKELRLVLTRKCNYDCYFCHGEGVEKNCKDLMNSSDYEFLLSYCKNKFGWDTVTLTGGEPFVRSDIDEIIDSAYKLNMKTTVVSNGELIKKHLPSFNKINRLNVSIHSFEDTTYTKIVGRKNKLSKVK